MRAVIFQRLESRVFGESLILLEGEEMMNKDFVSTLLLCGLFLCHGCGGIGFAYQQKLPGKFGLVACDTRTQMSLCEMLPGGSASGIIRETVFAVGWNDDFILAERHPSAGSAPYVINRSVTEFYILTVATGKVVGPLDADGFDKQRAVLGVPKGLAFSLVFNDLQ